MAAAPKRYLSGGAARSKVAAEVRLAPPQTDTSGSQLAMRYAGFTTEDYIVHEGIPSGRPVCEVRIKTVVGCGHPVFSDTPPNPRDVNIEATARWLPLAGAFAGDGSSWEPSIGGGHAFAAGQAAAPYLDGDYSYKVRGGAELAAPAVVFSEGSWMKLDTAAYSAQAFTLAIVAVMHLHPDGPVFGILESHVDRDDPDVELASAPTDWGLRYRQGTIELWAGGAVASHSVLRAQARPVVIAISLGDNGGRMVVLDRTKSSHAFGTDDIDYYDSTLYLGRTGNSAALTETAWMDVLEVDFFDHALSFPEIDDLLHELDSCYGVSG